MSLFRRSPSLVSLHRSHSDCSIWRRLAIWYLAQAWRCCYRSVLPYTFPRLRGLLLLCAGIWWGVCIMMGEIEFARHGLKQALQWYPHFVRETTVTFTLAQPSTGELK